MFLFEGKERAMLVDTGFGTLPLKEIVSGLTPLPVFVVNTHTDGDHTACNNDFDTLYMHPSEMDYYVWHGRKAGEREPKLMPLWEGDVIDLDYWKFEVLLTPGHTPGSIMLLEREKTDAGQRGYYTKRGDLYVRPGPQPACPYGDIGEIGSDER